MRYDGRCALVGKEAADAEATLNLNRLRRGHVLCGNLFGGGVPAIFVPRLVALYERQGLPIDRMITEYRLDDINRAADDLLTGAAVKAVLIMPQERARRPEPDTAGPRRNSDVIEPSIAKGAARSSDSRKRARREPARRRQIRGDQ